MRLFKRFKRPSSTRAVGDALVAASDAQIKGMLSLIDMEELKLPLFSVMLDYSRWLKEQIATLKQESPTGSLLAERERQLESLIPLAYIFFVETSENIVKTSSKTVSIADPNKAISIARRQAADIPEAIKEYRNAGADLLQTITTVVPPKTDLHARAAALLVAFET